MRENASKYVRYIRETFAPEDAALANVGSHLSPEESRMQIGADEGKILNSLVAMTGAKKIVEIGVLAGYSAIWMARALPEDGRLYALEKNHTRIKPISANFKACGVADKIELIQGDALENLPKLEEKGPFDIVFIDADKGNYCNYLDWAEKNVRKGGLIIGDNAFLFGAVYGEKVRDINPDTVEVMKLFNKRLADPARYNAMMIPTIEGLVVAVKI